MDLISREAALDCFHDWIDRHGDVHTPDEMAEYQAIEELPAVEPEKRTEERTETHSCDCISRQAAIDALDEIEAEVADGYGYQYAKWREYFVEMPSAQPEIIRCKDCKYQDEGYRRISVKWLPCMDLRPGSNWYCGSAERREE